MRAVIQRVTRASVTVENKVVGAIEGGFLVLLGVGADDTERDCDRLAQKLLGLRIFSDEQGKINRSLNDVGGGLLVVSQFTLYADCRKGNRPSFTAAKEPKEAERLYEYFCGLCAAQVPVQKGIFGADMSVELINDGPFTVVLEFVNGEIM